MSPDVVRAVDELGSKGILPPHIVPRLRRIAAGELISIRRELEVLLYFGVALVVAGVGLLVKRNLARLGPLTVAIAIGAAAAGCLAWCWRKGKRTDLAFEYVLTLGALLVAADLAFIEVKFTPLGASWPWHLAIVAALYAVLPTRLSYAEKWRLRKGLAAFLEGERAKRAALEQGGGAALHPQSPFEGISQESIEPAIARRFDVIERREFCPFFFYLAPKLRLPAGLRLPVARALRRAEDVLRDLRLARGAYFVMECRRRAGA